MSGKDDRYRYETISSPFTTADVLVLRGQLEALPVLGRVEQAADRTVDVIWGIGSEPSFPRGRRRSRRQSRPGVPLTAREIFLTG